MLNCQICGKLFKPIAEKSKVLCPHCKLVEEEEIDQFSEYDTDIEILVNPNGRTQPQYIE